jgi:O-antigen biosynthesis protein
VLYVNPLGLRRPRARDLRRLLARIAASGQPAPGVRLLRSLLVWPAPTLKTAIRWNARRLQRSVERWLGPNTASPVLWVGVPNPVVAQAVGNLPRHRLVYDCLDPFSSFHRSSDLIQRTENEIARRADNVFATSGRLLDAMRTLNPSACLLSNAVDVDHFAQPLAALPAPPDLAALPRPWLGYVGEIADWLDIAAIHALAGDGASVVLLGPGRGPVLRAARNHPGVHWLGAQPYAQLPSYVSHFDVCLLPFTVNDFTDAINPVKLYEYLASGRPVVSAPIAEAKRLSDVVTIVEGGSSWQETVHRALSAANDDAARERRIAVARANTWEQRVETIVPLLARP